MERVYKFFMEQSVTLLLTCLSNMTVMLQALVSSNRYNAQEGTSHLSHLHSHSPAKAFGDAGNLLWGASVILAATCSSNKHCRTRTGFLSYRKTRGKGVEYISAGLISYGVII